MITVKYRCKEHGVFTVDLEIGGRGRVGRSPSTQPCPTCSTECHRLHQAGLSVTKATFERMQAYCEAHHITMGGLVEVALEDILR